MARFLIDANLPRWFSLWAGGDREFVHDFGPDWSDTDIWNHAASHGRVEGRGFFRPRIDQSGRTKRHTRVGNLMMADFHRYLLGIWTDVCRASESSRLVQVYRDRIESMD